MATAVVAQVSIAGALRNRSPQTALSVLPIDAEARARLAATLVGGSPNPAAREAARALALDSIRRSPVNPVALRALALATDQTTVRGLARSAEIFAEAEHLSRRDQVTQLWLATYYLRREDLPAVMRHFDIALRTSPSGTQTLFPLLATAATDRRIADELIDRMREKPEWALPFATSLLSEQVAPPTAAYLIGNGLDPKIPAEREVIQKLVQRLAGTGELDLAWRLFAKARLGGSDTGRSVRDGGFDTSRGVVPFAWDMTQASDFYAAREQRPDGTGSALYLVATSGQSRELARQLLRLPGGEYRLAAEFGNVPMDRFNRPEVSVRCADGQGSRVLTAMKPSTPGPKAMRMTAHLTVPSGCVFQWLAVSIAGDDRQDTEAPWIDNVAVSAVRN